ncbi:MAG: histidine phosphotransferase family protein [Paracoccaceae bacterium]
MNGDLALAGLVASRICHDLISPVGAIGNGLELMREPGSGAEEMALLVDCSEAATSSLQFLRLAFGARDPNESLGRDEFSSAITPYFSRRKCALDLGDCPESMNFGAARPLIWLALIGAGALPRGGELALTSAASAPLALEWAVRGESRMQAKASALLSAPPALAEVGPGEVHFLLLWRTAQAAGARPHWRPDSISGGAIGLAGATAR